VRNAWPVTYGLPFGLRVLLLLATVLVRPASSAGAQSVPMAVAADPSRSAQSVPYPFAVFVGQVLADHPVVRQAELVAEDTRQQLRTAWGAFDPTISASWDQKRFTGTPYYSYADASIKIPTPIGSDIKVSLERASGVYISNDRRTPAVGLLSAGISVPLGQRLLTDERRTALTQAQAVRDAGVADRRTLLNNLLVTAARTYGNWYEQWQRLAIAREGVALATFRLSATRERVRNGDNPPIDTLEASLEVARREVQALEAGAAYYAAWLSLNALLWDATGAPVQLADTVAPVLDGVRADGITPMDSLQIAQWVETARRTNPQLQRLVAEVSVTEAQRRLVSQQRIPFAEASVAALAARGDGLSLGDRFGDDDSYKAELNIRSSLLYLKEMGRYGSALARAESRRVERDRVARDVENAVWIAANELHVLREIVVQQSANVERLAVLRDAEQVRFENGESTLLIVNLRERAVLDEAVRLAQLEARVAAARATLAAAIGDPLAVAGVRGEIP